jgi:hypothetical protein
MQNESQPVQMPQVQAGDETLIILESLLCVMREKNLLTRQDIELLCQKVDRRAAGSARIRCPAAPKRRRMRRTISIASAPISASAMAGSISAG